MIKNFLLLISFSFFGLVSNSQAYNDAINLRNNHFNKTSSKILIDSSTVPILKKYFHADTLTINSPEIKTNPFLKDMFITKGTSADFVNKIGTLPSSSFSFSSIGGLDVINIADGLAKFLVKRTKEELTISFFSKFDTLISKYPDLRTVFPQTYQSLSIIGDEIYNYQGYIQTLKESFEKDLQNLTTNLPSITKNHPTFFSAHKELAVTLKSGCYISEELRDKAHPGDIIANYPAEYLDSLNANWKGAIQTLQLISSSLRDTASNDDNTDTVNYWVSAKQVKKLVTDPIAFKIYLGLIYQQALTFNKDANNNPVPITFQDKTLNQVLTDIAPTYMQSSTFITNFGAKADKLNTLIKQYKKQASDSLLIQQYYNYATTTIDLFKQGATITDIDAVRKALNGINLSDTLSRYFDAAQSTADLVLNISKRNYSGAIVNVTHIYDIVIAGQAKKDIEEHSVNTGDASKALKKLKKNVKQQVKQANNISDLHSVDIKQITDSTALTSALRTALNNADTLASFNGIKTVQSSIFKYGSFMAAMVLAKSSDDVQNTIEAFALPSGSSRIKRESPFNVSLNAYTGLYTGYERIKDFDKGSFKFNSFGVAAPIGIAASIGSRRFFWTGTKDKNDHWSYSLFVSLIDLGAVAAFRFNNDSTVIKNNNTSENASASQSSSIQLKDIVSPGAFLSIGIPKCPLSVNFGAQMGPNLRNITSANNTAQLNFNNNIYWRYSVSLVVDIPVLNFYTKSK